MPVCPPISPEERAAVERWENVVGKAVKDWVTRIMKRDGLTRAEARRRVFGYINGADWVCTCQLEGKGPNYSVPKMKSCPVHGKDL